MSTIYVFDGTGGCDYCIEATSYSIDEEPLRPHPYCDCPIFEIDTEDLADCEMILTDLIVDEYEFHEEISVYAIGCEETTDGAIPFGRDEDVQEGFDEGLRELIDASGWTPPSTEPLSGDLILEHGWIHTITVTFVRYVAIFEAEVAYNCTVGGTVVTIPGGQKTGFYEKTYRVDIERDSERCPDNPEGVDVPDLADDEALATYLGDDDDEDTG